MISCSYRARHIYTLSCLETSTLNDKEKIEWVVEANPLALLRGNRSLEIVASLLVYKGTFYKHLPCKPAKDPLSSLPIVVLDNICKRLTLADRLAVARTCKWLFSCICGPDGKSIWSEEGCIDAARNMHDLTVLLYKNNRLRAAAMHPDMPGTSSFKRRGSITAKLLHDAFFLAWPKPLLFMFPKAENDPDKWLESQMALFLGTKSDKAPNYDHLHPLVVARHLREHPSNLTYMIRFVGSYKWVRETWAILHRFGLPLAAVDPFCEGIRKALKHNSPIHYGGVLGLTDRIRLDYPHIDLRAKIPAMCLNTMVIP